MTNKSCLLIQFPLLVLGCTPSTINRNTISRQSSSFCRLSSTTCQSVAWNKRWFTQGMVSTILRCTILRCFCLFVMTKSQIKILKQYPSTVRALHCKLVTWCFEPGQPHRVTVISRLISPLWCSWWSYTSDDYTRVIRVRNNNTKKKKKKPKPRIKTTTIRSKYATQVNNKDLSGLR